MLNKLLRGVVEETAPQFFVFKKRVHFLSLMQSKLWIDWSLYGVKHLLIRSQADAR